MLFACGCPARHTDFRPIDAPPALGQGHAAVYYEIEVNGRNMGDLRIWSPGGYRADLNGRDHTIHIQFRLRNDGQSPVTVDLTGTHIEVASDDAVWLILDEEARVEGRLEVAPGAVERIHLYYRLPDGVGHRDVNAFELNWRLWTEAGPLTQSTPFVQDRPARDRVRYRPYMGFHGYWGPGFGPRWGPSWWW